MLEIDDDEAIYDTIDGKEKVFCCQGFIIILHDENFNRFYKRREGWQPGLSEQVKTSPELFKDVVRENDGEYEIDLSLSGIRCVLCIWLIEHFLKKLEGIISVMVNYATHKARIQ